MLPSQLPGWNARPGAWTIRGFAGTADRSGPFRRVPRIGLRPSFSGAWTAYPFFASGNVIVSHINEGLFVLRPNLTSAPPTPPTDLTLQPLRDWLKTNWYDGLHTDLGYNSAREQMYGSVDEVGSQIECVYTGFQQAAEFVTFPDPINAEHLVPQSYYGSISPMRSDIWSLRPAHGSPNSARSNNPYGEVDDATAQWYGVDGQGNYISTGTIPANPDDFSERSGGVWEPRESQKGDVARAVYYFYTMYPTQAGDLSGVCDPQTLYDWHLADPVSAFEVQRNDRIETAQGNRNPYVDDPTLVFRAWYFAALSPGCTNAAACNYDAAASSDDGSCILLGTPCDDGDALTFGDVYTDCSAPNFGCQGSGPTTIWEETFGGFASLGYGYNGSSNSAASETEWSITCRRGNGLLLHGDHPQWGHGLCRQGPRLRLHVDVAGDRRLWDSQTYKPRLT